MKKMKYRVIDLKPLDWNKVDAQVRGTVLGTVSQIPSLMTAHDLLDHGTIGLGQFQH